MKAASNIISRKRLYYVTRQHIAEKLQYQYYSSAFANSSRLLFGQQPKSYGRVCPSHVRCTYTFFCAVTAYSEESNMAAEVSDHTATDPMDELYARIDPFHKMPKIFVYYCMSVGGPIVTVGGVFANIFTFVVLVRSRLWLKHEGYVYLAAIFCVNVGILLFCTSSFWFTSAYGFAGYYPPYSSNFMCKLWHFLMSVFFASGWLSVALLTGAYLREHQRPRGRCGCPMFAAKYCTLFTSKIIVGVTFVALFVGGVPYLALFEVPPREGICFVSKLKALSYSLLGESVLMWLVPFVLFLPVMIMTLCRSAKREASVFGFSQTDERSASDEQMRVTAVTLSTTNLCSQLFLVFTHYSFLFFNDVGEFYILVHGLAVTVQPILCFFLLRDLREGFRSQLRGIAFCCRRCQKVDVGLHHHPVRDDPEILLK